MAALEATKRYLTSSAGVTFREAFEVEHDRVFDEFPLGRRPRPWRLTGAPTAHLPPPLRGLPMSY
jgi:hypothetical protein